MFKLGRQCLTLLELSYLKCTSEPAVLQQLKQLPEIFVDKLSKRVLQKQSSKTSAARKELRESPEIYGHIQPTSRLWHSMYYISECYLNMCEALYSVPEEEDLDYFERITNVIRRSIWLNERIEGYIYERYVHFRATGNVLPTPRVSYFMPETRNNLN